MKKTRYISAGAGERMQYLAHKFNDTTIRFVLRYPGFPDPDILCAAAKTVIDGVDVLHSSFICNSRNCHWRVNENYEAADFFALVQCGGDPMPVAAHLAVAPVAHRDKCQLQVTLVQGSESSAVLVRLSHLVVDGSDGKYLLSKLAEAYRLLEENRDPEALSIKDGSRSAMNAYSGLTVRELRALVKPPFSGVKTDFPFRDPNGHGPLRMLRCSIPGELLTRARVKAKTQGASVNDLLLTACYRSYAGVTGREGDMSVAGMMDLRQHCKDGTSEGLANMSGGLNTTLHYVPGSSFTENLAALVPQTLAGKQDPLAGLDGLPLIHAATKTVPMELLLKAADLVYANMSLSLTNLGSIPCEPLTMAGLKPTGGLFGGPLKRKPSVQVGAASFDGALELTLLGDFLTEDLESLEAFLTGIRQELEGYLEEN